MSDADQTYDEFARRLREDGRDVEEIAGALGEIRGRDAVLGLRRLGHPLRDLPPARPSAQRLREARGRRRGASSDGRRSGRRAAFPVGCGRRSRRVDAPRRRSRAALRRGQPEPVPGPRLSPRLDRQPRSAVRRKALDHLLECVEVATALGSTAQSLWLADGTNYPGQDDLAARHERIVACLASSTRRCRPSRSCLSSTSSSSPPSTPRTLRIGALPC